MKIRNALFAVMFVAAPAFAQSETYVIDTSHTQPQFTINHLGFSVQHGRFDNTTGKVVLDTAAKTGSVDISIDTASISTGWAARDEHLKTKDFFNVEKFPAMTYKSSKLHFDGDKLVSVDGELTLLGVSKPVTLKVSNFHCGQNPINKKQECGAQADAVIKRSDFGMSAYVPAVGDEVTLSIPVEAVKQ